GGRLEGWAAQKLVGRAFFHPLRTRRRQSYAASATTRLRASCLARWGAVAAVVLGAIERGVGALEDIRDRLAIALQGREPDRDRDRDALGSLGYRERLPPRRAPVPFGYHHGG